jgi:hypothetical protein
MDCSKNGANERAMASGKPIPHQGIDQELAMVCEAGAARGNVLK